MGPYLENRFKQVECNSKFFAKEGFTIPFISEIIKRARLSIWDCYQLFYYAKRIPNHGIFLEIGTWTGGSLLCAFLGTQMAKTSINFITIDIKIDQTEFAGIKKLIPKVKVLLFPSDVAKEEIKDNSIDLCFIDGDHEHAKQDFLNYWPKIKIGGVLLGHDYIGQHKEVVTAADGVFGKELILLKNSAIFKVKKMTEELC